MTRAPGPTPDDSGDHQQPWFGAGAIRVPGQQRQSGSEDDRRRAHQRGHDCLLDPLDLHGLILPEP
jgi:hypothetical protein